MNIPGEEWREEDESIVLGPELARKYQEAGTMFLCQIEDSPILQARINRVSPNGQYAKTQVAPEREVWLPLDKMKVLDVLAPMKSKEPVVLPPLPPKVEQMLAALMGVEEETADKPKSKKKGKENE